MENNNIVLIAGGTGFIGKALCEVLKTKGYEVRVLSRKASNESLKIFQWNPEEKTIDKNALLNVKILINLVGEGIADKRWTDARKKLLVDSRVNPANFLFSLRHELPMLEQYISASGINAYGFNNEHKLYSENDEYGTDFVSQIVQKWENAAQQFSEICPVSILRIAVVLDKNHGALPKIAMPVKFFIGSALGNGKQNMPWIGIFDLCKLVEHVIQNKLSGTYNAIANNNSNKNFTKTLANVLHRPYFPIGVPGFVLKLILGERANLVLLGVKASNSKITQSGFVFSDGELKKCLTTIYA